MSARRTPAGADRSLFALERSLISTPAKKRREIRQARAAPIIDAFFEWCHRQREHVLDQSPIAQGIGYACNQQQALRRFLDDGRLPVHNNISEMNLRREVIGRKNCARAAAHLHPGLGPHQHHRLRLPGRQYVVGSQDGKLYYVDSLGDFN